MNLKSITANSDKGPHLNINEDKVFYNLKDNLFMILDGFGGSGVGDIAVTDIANDIDKMYGNLTVDLDSTLPFFYSAKYLLEVNALVNAIISSNEILYKKNMTKEFSRRAGASAIVATIADSILSFISIGTCRVYLIRESRIEKILTEDSLEFLSDSNTSQNYKLIPSNAFGLYPDLNYQVREVRVQKGDKFLFLTDGVYSKLRDEELKDIANNKNTTTQNRIDEIFELSNSRGNLDNQSCLFLEY
jgi:serine/threonine protein phosphatase PrpC